MSSHLQTMPFDTLYQDLRLWGQQSQKWRKDFIPMSAGVNWSRPNPAVVELLAYELSHCMTLRNYGPAAGSPAVTRLLEMVECKQHGTSGLSATLVHGTTEGAYLGIQHMCRSGALSAGDTAMMLGHGFPLYHRLCGEFGLKFSECLGFPDGAESFMPTREAVAEVLADCQPALLFLILPNNPLGEVIGPALLEEIAEYVRRRKARLIVDRVCLMPWDNCDAVYSALGPLVRSGHAIVVDSFSKSESLAGLRAGYLVSDQATKDSIAESIKSRFLNPVVFGTATLAVTRLSHVGGSTERRLADAYRDAHDAIFSEYPREEAFKAFFDKALEVMPAYRAGLAERRQTLNNNFASLQARFRDRLTHALRFDAGFNAALSTVDMEGARELDDQRTLAQEHGVGILTSHCFSQALTGERYFVRIGLTLPEDDFAEGLSRLHSYYLKGRSFS